jgi:ABC-type glycerol-3-phosphate transport system substrate-binding protein
VSRRLLLPFVLALVAGLAAVAAATTASAAVSGTLRIVGPWTGADEQSFRAVLDGFRQQNPGVNITYQSVSGSAAGEISKTAESQPDLAVLALPADLATMRTMARDGSLKPIDFAVPTVRANYAFSWKRLGSVDGKLYGVFLKATNRSAFWYEQRLFQNEGLAAPTSWKGLQRVSGALAGLGAKPFAVSGASALALPDLFANVYLTFDGNRRYDRLARGEIRWTDATVRDALVRMRATLVNPTRIAGGLGSLRGGFDSAVQKVFGSPLKAAMVPGGSAVIPVLHSAKAVRPITQFGAFPFPTTDGQGPPRVIGDAHTVVMVKDSPAARALIEYLATPGAATIWAKRSIDFLSPNRKVDPASYSVPAVRTLATALSRATVFRFGLADTGSPNFRTTLNRLLMEYVQNPARINQITAQLQAAAVSA